jgi:putative oxidoreductase
MNVIQRLETYGESHHPAWLDGLRIVLGLVIFFKGIVFISDTAALTQMLQNSKFPWMSFGLAHYIAFAHLVGGILILLGLKTRIAILFQIPILLGAVILVNAPRGLFTGNTELFFSLLVLALLIFFFFWGSGPLSMDRFWKKHPHW